MIEHDRVASLNATPAIDEPALRDLVRELVTTPSDTPDGEIAAASVVERFLHAHGIATRRQTVDQFGVNLIAEIPATGQEPGLLFNGHLDVVPPTAGMPYPPFAGTVVQEVMWGRGTVDMKGGLAAMAVALAALQTSGQPLRRPLLLAAVASEEKGNRGTHTLVQAGVRARWAVVGEATALDVIIAHKGVERYQVIVEGNAAHESTPERGTNAIILAAHLIAALDEELFRQPGGPTHPLLGQATYNIGTIQGGTSRNTVPDRCAFQMAKRWLPGDSPEAIRTEIDAVVTRTQPSGHVVIRREPEFEEIPHPPLEVPPDHPLVIALGAAVTRVTGRPPALLGMAGFTDAALLAGAGIPAVICGPGNMALAHTDVESIALAEVAQAARVYAAFAATVCQQE